MTHARPTSEADTSSWLTGDFLQDILQNTEDDRALIVEKIDIGCALGKGENYGSSLHRVVASVRDGDGRLSERSFIVKRLPELEMMQRFAKELLLFEKELYAYRSLLPAMRGLTDSPLVSPRFFPTDTPGTIVLEDISTAGFKMADRRTGLNLAHCLLTLRTLAKFHGLSAEVVRRDPSVVQHLPECVHAKRRRDIHKSYLPNVYSYLADIVEKWHGFERFGEKIRRFKDNIIEDLEELLLPEEKGFNVVNHGDFWVNNMMFRYSDVTQLVEEVCLVDFQILRFGSPVLDLHYFFATSPTDNVREEHEDKLLDTYHESLMETIDAFNFDNNVYSREQLKKDFNDKMKYGFHVVCTILCAVVAEPSDAMDLDSVTDESIESKDVNYLAKALQGERFRHTFQRVLVFYEKKGFI